MECKVALMTTLQVEFEPVADQITGQVRDEQGNGWPFSSWLDLLTLIERLRTDPAGTKNAVTHDEVPIAIEGDGVAVTDHITNEG